MCRRSLIKLWRHWHPVPWYMTQTWCLAHLMNENSCESYLVKWRHCCGTININVCSLLSWLRAGRMTSKNCLHWVAWMLPHVFWALWLRSWLAGSTLGGSSVVRRLRDFKLCRFGKLKESHIASCQDRQIWPIHNTETTLFMYGLSDVPTTDTLTCLYINQQDQVIHI